MGAFTIIMYTLVLLKRTHCYLLCLSEAHREVRKAVVISKMMPELLNEAFLAEAMRQKP